MLTIKSKKSKSRLVVIKKPDMCEKLQISEPTLDRLTKSGRIPQPIHIGQRAIAWVESEVDAWLLSKHQEANSVK